MISAEGRCYIKRRLAHRLNPCANSYRGEVVADAERADSRSIAVSGMSGSFALHTFPKRVLTARLAPGRSTFN